MDVLALVEAAGYPAFLIAITTLVCYVGVKG
jgi:hypothetical protein